MEYGELIDNKINPTSNYIYNEIVKYYNDPTLQRLKI